MMLVGCRAGDTIYTRVPEFVGEQTRLRKARGTCAGSMGVIVGIVPENACAVMPKVKPQTKGSQVAFTRNGLDQVIDDSCAGLKLANIHVASVHTRQKQRAWTVLSLNFWGICCKIGLKHE